MDLALNNQQKLICHKTQTTNQLESCQKAEQAIEYEGDGSTNNSWCTQNSPHRLGKETGRIGNQRKNRDHADYRIVSMG